MREVLLRIDRTISERTRELMSQTSHELSEGMRETREDDKAVRAALFGLIDEIRGWRQGHGPAPA